MSTLNRWYEQNKEKADFRVVYISEAHPTDGWQVPQNTRQGVLVATHRGLEDREKAARKLRDDLGVKIPMVLDGMDDRLANTYAAWPDRIFVIDKDLKIVYRGALGPAGFRPAEAMAALERISANSLQSAWSELGALRR